jgi:aryl-alcohol dehydrogenase (NADP+)
MKLNKLANSDLVVSELCLGTMTFGEQNSPAEAHAQLDYAVANGINFIDAAEMYPVPAKAETQGRTESYIGEWLVKQPRDKLIVATKVGASNRDIAWLRGGPKALDEANINQALNASLKRLKTDYVDLYQIHWPERKLPPFGQTDYDPAVARDGVPIREQLEVFKTLVDAGKIRYIGLSNETPWGVIEFVRLAEQHGLPRVVSIQNSYNLINRTFEVNLTEVIHREGVPLLAYSPLGFGTLSGKYIGRKPPGARFTLFPQFGQRYYKQNVPEAVAAYVDLAARRRLSPAQLAIAFVRSRWFVASTIIGATTLEQLKTNIDSVNVTLDEATLSEIQHIHQRYPNPAP